MAKKPFKESEFDVFHPDEARKLVKESKDRIKIQESIDYINGLIKNQAEQGNTEVSRTYEGVSGSDVRHFERVIEAFELVGYDVRYEYDKNEPVVRFQELDKLYSDIQYMYSVFTITIKWN